MNPALPQLKDIHLPHAINGWLIAPGWLTLYLLVIVLSIFAINFYRQRQKQRSAVNFALSKLTVLEKCLAHNPDNINIASEISTLIRRTALYYFQRESIAGLSGQAWIRFLNKSGNTSQFSTVETLLIDAPYRKNDSSDLLPLFALTRAWLASLVHKNRSIAEK